MGMFDDAFGDFTGVVQQNLENAQDVLTTPAPAHTAHSTWDYIKDVPVGTVRGAVKGAQGLVDLGLMPVDYLLNTNLTKHVDNLFDKITPETNDTFFGGLAEGIAQFGVPLGAATKIVNGIKFFNEISRIRKLSTIPTNFGKAEELVRRMGYYGGIGALSTIAAEVPAKDKTISQAFGLSEKEDFDQLSGRERAAAGLKEKLQAGLEAGAVGAALPVAVDTAGALVKNVINPLVISPTLSVLSPVTSAFSKAVFDPAAKVLAGSEILGIKTPELIPTLFRTISKGTEKASDFLMDKLGLQPIEDWKYNSLNGTFGQAMYKGLNTVKNMLTTEGVSPAEAALKKQNLNAITATTEDQIVRTAKSLDSVLQDIVTNGEKRFFEGKETLGSLIEKQNDVNNYITAPAKDKQRFFNLIDKDARPYALELDKMKTEFNNAYADFLLDVGGTPYKNMGELIKANSESYLKQRFSAFNNPNYQYDPTAEKKAVEFMKSRILDNEREIGVIKIRSGTEDINSPEFQKGLTEMAENKMIALKQELIKSGKTPQYYFNAIAKSFDTEIPKTTLRPGQHFDEAIRELFDAPQYTINKLGQKIEITDYKASLLDTIMHQSLTMRNRQYFDDLLKEGLDNGLIFSSKEDAINKLLKKWIKPNSTPEEIEALKTRAAKFSQDLQLINGGKLASDIKNTLVGDSDLFNGNYFTTREFQNAIQGSNDAQTGLFSIPLYKQLMQAKTASQISKTLLSPATQARNLGSSGLYLLANGLIGTDVSLKDAVKAITKDLYTAGVKRGADAIDELGGIVGKTALEDQGILKYLNDAKQRGVLTQNIEVNDMKYILNAARDGNISFDNFLNSPVIKKLSDAYTASDNLWKIYADKFYTAALKPAMRYAEERFVNDGGDLSKLSPQQISKLHMLEIEQWYKDVAGIKFDRHNIFTGQEKSVDDSLREMSAFLVTNTMPTYSKTPSIIKFARQFPVGNFIAYPSEIIRTSSNIVAYAARELTSDNPYIRQMGAKRLMGLVSMMYGLDETAKQVSSYYTGIDQEQIEAYKRNFAPEYQRNATLIPITAADGNGNFKYYNMTYTDPYTVVKEPIHAILNAYADGSLTKKTVNQKIMDGFLGNENRPGAFSTFFQPFISESLAAQSVFDVISRDGKTRDGKYVYYPQDNIGTKLDKSFGNFLDKIEPGALTSARYIWQGATGKFTDAGTVRDAGNEITKLLTGVRLEDAKPLNSMPFVLNSFNKDKEGINSKFSNTFYSPGVSAENRIASMKDYFMESYDSQSRLNQTIKDARTLGVRQGDIQQILTQRFKNTNEVNSIINGDFKTPVYSQSRIQSLLDRLQKEDPSGARQIQLQFDRINSSFDRLKSRFSGKKLGENLNDISDQLNSVLESSISSFRGNTGPIVDLSNVSIPNLGSLFKLPSFTGTANAAVPNQIAPRTALPTPTTVSPQVVRPTNPVQGLQNEQARLNAYFPNDKIL